MTVYLVIDKRDNGPVAIFESKEDAEKFRRHSSILNGDIYGCAAWQTARFDDVTNSVESIK